MENPNKKQKDQDEVKEREEKKVEQERQIDEQLEQTFPASDPPSYSQPNGDSDE